jgi:hypothetical protein
MINLLLIKNFFLFLQLFNLTLLQFMQILNLEKELLWLGYTKRFSKQFLL